MELSGKKMKSLKTKGCEKEIIVQGHSSSAMYKAALLLW